MAAADPPLVSTAWMDRNLTDALKHRHAAAMVWLQGSISGADDAVPPAVGGSSSGTPTERTNVWHSIDER
jgi:hypothetical protein